jgi:hypothetical protein
MIKCYIEVGENLMKDVAINEGRVIIKEIQDFFIRNR